MARMKKRIAHRITHRHLGLDGPFSGAIHRMQAEVRRRIQRLDPEDRGRAWRLAGIQQTHFYAFVRGDDRRLSAASLDPLCDLLGIEFEVTCPST